MTTVRPDTAPQTGAELDSLSLPDSESQANPVPVPNLCSLQVMCLAGKPSYDATGSWLIAI